MLVIIYLAAVVAANLLVAQFGAAATIFNAFVFIGLDLSARDTLHTRWQGRNLARNMALLIITGSVISAALNAQAGQIALASCLAFAAAGIADTLVYTLLGERSRLVKMNGSNLVSAAVDSFIFPLIAFGSILPAIVLGQWVAKVAGGFIWSIILNAYQEKNNHVRSIR